MKKPITRLALPLVMALLIALCLLTLAGPVLAGSPFLGNPPGDQWGGPHFNGTIVFTSDNTTAVVTAADPRGSGDLLVTIESVDTWVEGNTWYARYIADATLTNSGGVWNFTNAEVLQSGPVNGVGAGEATIVFASTGTGGGGYEGLTYVVAWHSGVGRAAPDAYKGWIY